MDILSQANAKRKKVFYGWWMLAAATLINFIGVGFFFYGWSTFFKPLQREFGWSRTMVSLLSSLSRLEGMVEGPIVGWLIDKIGAKMLIVVGAVMTGAGFILLWLVQSPWQMFVIFGFLSLGYNAGFSHGTGAIVAKWFIKKRSQAFAILTTGNGIGGAALVPVVAWLIIQFGWRWTAIIIGLVIYAVVIPLGLAIKNMPEQVGLLPDGESGEQARESKQKGEPAETAAPSGAYGLDEVNFTWREAMRTQAFWIYSGSMFLRSAILSTIVIHQIPHLTDIGVPEIQAASVLGLMVLFSVPGRLAFGWMGDRVNKRVLLLALCLVQALGIVIFIHARNVSLLYLFVVVYGLGYGGVIPLTTALRADLFGRESYATIAGIMTPITAVPGILGPTIAGYMFDVTGSYTTVFYTFAIMIVLSGFLFLLVRQPKPPVRLARITPASS